MLFSGSGLVTQEMFWFVASTRTVGLERLCSMKPEVTNPSEGALPGQEEGLAFAQPLLRLP